MTDQSVEVFKALDWQAHSIRQLRSRDDDDANDFWNDFFEAYRNTPLGEIESFKRRLFGYEYIFRGAVWELFLWRGLSQAVKSIEIERPIGDSLKNADFAWEYRDKIVMLEATTIKRSNLEIRASSSESQLVTTVEKDFNYLDHTIHITTLKASETDLKIDEILHYLKSFYKRIDNGDFKSALKHITTWKDFESDWHLEIAFIRAQEIDTALTPTVVLLSPFKERRDEDPRGMVEILRRSLQDKLGKFDAVTDENCVIAISHELDALGESRHSQYFTLIGRPSVTFNLNTDESSVELTDLGFFLTDLSHTKKISAVLFGYGYIPGFSSIIKPILWLNPCANNQLDPLGFPLDVVVVKVGNPGSIVVKESNLDSLEWETITLF